MFEIVPTPGSQEDLLRLPAAAIADIRAAIHKYLRATPHIPHGTRLKKLHHFHPPLYRLRVGDYRVYYRLQEQRVVLLAILNRREADRWLARQISGS